MVSWFTAVKKAFSPHKPSKTTTQDHEHQDDDKILQKKEKRRWLFRKSSVSLQLQQTQVKDNETNSSTNYVSRPKDLTTKDEKHAALMTDDVVKAAEAASATAHAAAEIIRVTARSSSVSVKYHFAAILIQTSFRGYLVCFFFSFSFYICMCPKAYRSFYSTLKCYTCLCKFLLFSHPY